MGCCSGRGTIAVFERRLGCPAAECGGVGRAQLCHAALLPIVGVQRERGVTSMDCSFALLVVGVQRVVQQAPVLWWLFDLLLVEVKRGRAAAALVQRVCAGAGRRRPKASHANAAALVKCRPTTGCSGRGTIVVF